MRIPLMAAIAGLCILPAAAPVSAQQVHWASKPADSAAAANSAAVMGQPDGAATSIAFYGFAYVRDFVPGRVTASALEKALKLSNGELARWDLILFQDRVPGDVRNFASAMIVAQDLVKVTSATYDGTTGMARPGTGAGWMFKTGNLPAVRFKTLFPGTRVASSSWLLVKLPVGTVNKVSPNLAVWIGGGPAPGVDNDPSPDAIGVIR